MSEAGRDIALAKFDKGAVVSRTLALYRELAARSRLWISTSSIDSTRTPDSEPAGSARARVIA